MTAYQTFNHSSYPLYHRDGDLFQKLKGATLNMIVTSLCQFLAGYAFCVCLKYVSENQVNPSLQIIPQNDELGVI